MCQEQGQPESGSFSGPLFIVGMPRSGTKLLREILNGHDDVHIPDVETEFIPYLYGRLAHCGGFADPAAFYALYGQMLKLPYFRYRLAQGRLIGADEWYGMCRKFDVGGIFEALIRVETGLNWGRPGIWGDKSPSYIVHLPLLYRLFPHAKFIHIVRDVRDYCRSIQRAWGKNPIRAAFRWNQALLKASEAVAGLSGQYMEIRYERLLEDAEGEVKKLCRFVGIDFQQEMLNVGTGTENLGDAKGVDGVASDNKGKFRSAFNRAVLLSIEEAAFPAMQLHDYQPILATAYRPPGALRLRMYQLLDGFNLIKADHPGKGRIGGALFHIAYKRITRIRS